MAQVDQLLDSLTSSEGFTPDWDDVLERAQVRPRPPLTKRPLRRYTLGLVSCVAALVVIASALGAAGIGPLSPIKRWIEGTPGKPASSAAVRAFQATNGHSWASFPRTTALRELLRATFAGQRYVLYGFRSGNSICLTLKAVTLQASVPPACAPTSVIEQLSSPVLPVVGNDEVLAFPERRSAQVSFGIAADQVRQIEVQTVNGEHTAVLGGNAYLWVDPSPASFNFVTSLRVTTATGARHSLTVPRPNPLALPLRPVTLKGPSRVQETISHPQIGWIERGEKRGLSLKEAHLSAKHLGALRLSSSIRLFKPDPLSDIVVGTDGSCIYLDYGYGCSPPNQIFSRGPVNFMISGGGPGNPSDQFVEVGGVAADGVTAVRAYLPDGQSLALPLKDNVFAGLSPNQMPLRLVAYARDGKIVGIESLGRHQAAPAAARTLRPILHLQGPGGVHADLQLGSEVANVRCWKLTTSARQSQGQCEDIPITGPWVTIEAVQDAGASVFVVGYLRAPVEQAALFFDDGNRSAARIADGWFLAAVPASELSTTRRHARVVGSDESGKVIQQPAFFYKLER